MARTRLLQLGFLVAGAAAVVVADLLADRLAVLSPQGPLSVFAALGGRVLGGFAVGMALRLQQSRKTKPDGAFRLWFGLPCALTAAVPVALATWPEAALGPASLIVGVQRLAPFAAAMLGITLALASRPVRR